MIKVTVLYSHPADAGAFEKYYAETHIPLAQKMPYVLKIETSKGLPGMDGGAPVYYRMAELYFDGPEMLQASAGSPEGQATMADITNFATGGATFLLNLIDE